MRKHITLITFTIVALGAFASVQAQTDLSMREAIYFTGSKSDSIDLAKDKYVAKESTINVNSDLAKSCDKTGCEFNVGIIGTRSGSLASQLSTYGLFSIEGSGLVGNTILFGASQATRTHVLPVKLKFGQNRLTFTIDPYKKTRESNEANNTFSVNVVVNRPGVSAAK